MAMVPKLIKAALNLQKALPEQVLSQGQVLLKGLTGNSNFTNLPVDLNAFKADLDTYAASIADAKDGGRKAITLRNKKGGVVIRTMKHLATYVELNCKDDMNIFLSSGFQPRPSASPPAQLNQSGFRPNRRTFVLACYDSCESYSNKSAQRKL